MGNSGADCIVLAAGLSSRMGSWKMVLPWYGSTVIETAVARALEVCRRVVLVTGHRGEELEELFAPASRVTAVRNEHYTRGMFSSVRTGAEAVTTERFFVLPGDMPGVGSVVYRSLLENAKGQVVLPRYRGRTGHPVLLNRDVQKAVLNAPEDGSLKDVLRMFPAQYVEMDDANIIHDLDTVEDYHERVV